MQYFDHNTNAGNDSKIIALRMEFGGAAVDAYWFILEKIYQSETDLDIFENRFVTNSVSHGLCIDKNTLISMVEAMVQIGLFEIVDGKLHSKRASENIAKYQQKAETARQNGKNGGRKPKQKPTKNQAGSSVATKQETALPTTKQNKTKQKDIGISPKEEIPISSASKGAAVVEATAPVAHEGTAPHCAKCGALMTFKPAQGVFHCMVHGMIKPGEGVEFR